MGRKLTEEELADPDFQALLVALEKVAKPVTLKAIKRWHRPAEQQATEPVPQDIKPTL